MQIHEDATTTLLEAEDLAMPFDFRERACTRRATETKPEERRRPCLALHDFLLVSARPELTPDLFPFAADPPGRYSCERNSPQK